MRLLLPPLAARLVLDHDHGSDRVRGWVCESCNARIGLYEWRDTNRESAKRIAAYLRWSWRHVKPAFYRLASRSRVATPESALANVAARKGEERAQ